jgi:electron transfer flavoprotein beta subunit
VKILVTVKRVEDPEQKIKIKPDGSGIVTEGLNYKPNPFDEIAIEEALRIREKSPGEIVAVTIGSAAAATELRQALALGADRGILVKCDAPVDSDGVARLLAKIVALEKPDLILMGKQAVDDDQNQAGQLLAEYLGIGQATFASKVESLESEAEKAKTPGVVVLPDGKSVRVIREIDGGLETVEVPLPAVVTVDLRLNLPRYASLPNIMKAKKKEVKEYSPKDLEVDPTPKVTVLSYSSPPVRKGGVKVPDVATLIDKLRNEAKVL